MRKPRRKIAILPVLLGVAALACARGGADPAGAGADACGPAGRSGAQDWPAGSLKGTVRGESGRPLSGARVLVEGTGCAAISGDDGSFHIPRVPIGTHTVVAQIIGYETFRRAGVEISEDTTTELELVLGGGTVRF